MPVSSPSGPLENKLVILPDTLNTYADSFSVSMLEADFLGVIDSVFFHAAVAPPSNPGFFLLVKVDASDAAAALIRLWSPELAYVFQQLVEKDCSCPALFE